MSPAVVKLSYMAIIDYLGGRNSEYQRLVSEALKMYEETKSKVKCKYIVNGIKIDAFIDWQTGVITDVNNKIIRGKAKC